MRNKDLKKSMKQISKITEDFTESAVQLNSVGDAVTIFGSARLKEGDSAYDDCIKLAKKLSDNGISIMTGGGPGIMEAGNKGSIMSDHPDAQSVAIGIELPFEQGLNEFADIELEHKYFATRKIHLTKHSFAYLAMAGGIGTLDEIAELACLINTGRLNSKPIVLVDNKFFGGLIDWLKTTVTQEGVLTHKEVDDFFVLADDWEHAFDIIMGYHKELSEEKK
jgi:uncharacterized protein (TIGR00730 family)